MLKAKIADFNSYGLTGTHDAAIGLGGSGATFFGTCRELEAEKQMNIRIYTAVLDQAYAKYDALGVAKGYGSHYFKVGGVKYFQDGSIQGLYRGLAGRLPHPARLAERPHLSPGRTQREVPLSPKKWRSHRRAWQRRRRHRVDLQALELAHEAHPREDARHMLIHCQMAHDDHIDRMKKLGVIPSYFINHIYYWGDRHKKLFIGPERAARMDPLGTSLKKGLLFSIHCDYPVTPIDPWFTMHTAVNRLTRSGEVLGPDERISPLEALKTFTTHAAMCSFEEDVKGSLEPGKLADFAVISDNMLEIDPLKIKDIRALRTVIGGRTVYRAEAD